MTGPRWALWALRFIWGWVALGLVLACVLELPRQIERTLEGDPVALGMIGAYVVIGMVLHMTYRHLWPAPPVDS